MKLTELILSLLLTFLSGGKTDTVSTESKQEDNYGLAETSSTDNFADKTSNREICITAVQGYTFAGGNSTNSISVRITQSGRRPFQQIRSTFRIVKSGKVIDNNQQHPFLSQSIVHLAGMYLSERYLFSICRLRL